MRNIFVIAGAVLLLIELVSWIATGEKPFVEYGPCHGSGPTAWCD